MFNFIFKVLFLAVTIAFLGVWGILKEQRKSQDLLDKIYSKMQKKIIKGLEKKEKLYLKEIESIILHTKASLFWSKEKVEIIDAKLAAKTLIEKMLAEDIIKENFYKNKKIYILK
jgi:hypothetical protein